MKVCVLYVAALFAFIAQNVSAFVPVAAGQPNVMLRGTVSGIVAPGKVDTPNTTSYMELTKDFVAQPVAPVAAEPAAKSKRKSKSKKSTKK